MIMFQHLLIQNEYLRIHSRSIILIMVILLKESTYLRDPVNAVLSFRLEARGVRR